MIDRSILNTLQSDGFIFADFKGTSMNPLFVSGRDKVLIEKKTQSLKKGDVALFVRNDGTHVLHRVYKVINGVYVFWGDNHLFLEYGVGDNAVIGIAKGYYKGEKYIDFSKSKKYKFYKAFWCKSVALRRFFNFFRLLFNKINKVFKGKNKKK